MIENGTMQNLIGSAAGILTTIAFLPQVIKTWKSKSADDISLIMFTVLFIGILLWLIYGMMLGSMPMIVANAVSLMLVGAIFTMKLLFN